MTYLTTCGLGPPRVCLPRKGTLFASKGHGYLGKPFLNCHDRLMPQTIKEATSKQVQPVFASKGHGYLGKPFLNCHDRLMPRWARLYWQAVQLSRKQPPNKSSQNSKSLPQSSFPRPQELGRHMWRAMRKGGKKAPQTRKNSSGTSNVCGNLV